MEPKNSPMPRWSLGSGSGLPYGSFANSLSSLTPKAEETEEPAISQRRSYIAVAVLCYINLLNYTERYTIAGKLTCCCLLTNTLTVSMLVGLNIMFVVSYRCPSRHSEFFWYKWWYSCTHTNRYEGAENTLTHAPMFGMSLFGPALLNIKLWNMCCKCIAENCWLLRDINITLHTHVLVSK